MIRLWLTFILFLNPSSSFAFELRSPALEFKTLNQHSEWTVSHPAPDRVSLTARGRKQLVVISEYSSSVSLEDERAYLRSSFKKDILQDRFGNWNVGVAPDVKNSEATIGDVDGLPYGDLSFQLDLPDSIAAFSERLFISGDRCWQIVIADYGSSTTSPTAQKDLADSLMKAIVLSSSSKGRSAWIDLLIPRAVAELGASGRTRTTTQPPATQVSPSVALPARCSAIPSNKRSTNGYGPHVDSQSVANCWNGIKGQTGAMAKACVDMAEGGWSLASGVAENVWDWFRKPRPPSPPEPPGPCGRAPVREKFTSYIAFAGSMLEHRRCEIEKGTEAVINSAPAMVTKTWNGTVSVVSSVAHALNPVTWFTNMFSSIANFGCYSAKAQAEIFCAGVEKAAVTIAAAALVGGGVAALTGRGIMEAAYLAAQERAMAMLPTGSNLVRGLATRALAGRVVKGVAQEVEHETIDEGTAEARRTAKEKAAALALKQAPRKGATVAEREAKARGEAEELRAQARRAKLAQNYNANVGKKAPVVPPSAPRVNALADYEQRTGQKLTIAHVTAGGRYGYEGVQDPTGRTLFYFKYKMRADSSVPGGMLINNIDAEVPTNDGKFLDAAKGNGFYSYMMNRMFQQTGARAVSSELQHDNITALNQKILEGYPPAEAFKLTPAGRVYQQNGFTKLQIPEIHPEDLNPDGTLKSFKFKIFKED